MKPLAKRHCLLIGLFLVVICITALLLRRNYDKREDFAILNAQDGEISAKPKVEADDQDSSMTLVVSEESPVEPSSSSTLEATLHEKNSSPEEVEVLTVDKRVSLMLSDEYISRLIDRDGVYSVARSLFDEKDLPDLAKLINNPKRVRTWRFVSSIVVALGESPQSEALLIDYITQGRDFDGSALAYESGRFIFGKVQAISYLGLVGGERSERFLQMAVTKEGVEALLSEWISGSLEDNAPKVRDETIALARGFAAMGLAYTGDPENIAIVEQINREAKLEVGGQNPSATSSSDRSPARLLLNDTVSALSRRDFINENGIDSWYEIMFDPEQRMWATLPYWEKYDIKE